jgi:hypothetical protein
MKKLNRIQNEKGVALITVVLLFLILVTLLGAAMFAAVTNQRNSILASEHSEAYYVAESGINLRISQLTDFLKDPGGYADYDPNIESMSEYLSSLVDDLNGSALLSFGNGNTANVFIEGPFDYPDFLDSQIFIVTSTGTVNGVSRTLQQEMILTVTFGESSPIDKAVVSRGSVIMRNGTNGIVKGAILTNGENLLLTYGSRMGTVGPVFELGDVDTNADIDGWCDNITDYGWPETKMPNLNNIILNGEVLGDSKINGDTSKFKNNNCFKNTDFYNEPAKIFPPVVVPPFPLNPYPVSVVNGKITLPDLRRIPGNFNGYIINGDLTVTSNITVELGAFGYSTQLKKIIVNGNFITSSQGTLNVTGNGRLVIMKSFTAATTPLTAKGYFVNWSANVNPAGNDPTKIIFMFDTPTGNLPTYNTEGHVTSNSTSGFVMTWGISNGGIFNASLLSENVNYEWSNAQVKGYIITNGDLVKITSGASTVASIPVWIYAPIGHVSLESNMTLYGSVLAKAVEFSAAQSMVDYQDMPDNITPIFNYLFYAQPTSGSGQAPSEANIFFSNIIEIDNE